MKYIFDGERLKRLRESFVLVDNQLCRIDDLLPIQKNKAIKLTQTELLNYLSENGCPIGRNSYSALENGRIPSELSLNQIVALCDIFDCDLNYLLRDSDYTSQKTKSICEYTGLSEKTAKQLHRTKDSTFPISEILSNFIDNYPSFVMLLDSIENYLVYSYQNKQLSQYYNGKVVGKFPLMEIAKADDEASLALMGCLRKIEDMRSNSKDNALIKKMAESEYPPSYAQIFSSDSP